MSVENIKAIFKLATPQEIKDGIAWYLEANTISKEIATKNNISHRTVTGVIAALSPTNKWHHNVRNAAELVNAFINGDAMESVKVSTYPKMKEKAWSILKDMLDGHDEIRTRLNGDKITAFYECIEGMDSCCIDGHAYNIWEGNRRNMQDVPSIGKKLRKEIVSDYVQAANETIVNGRPLKAYEMQAITWVTWRRIHGIV